jgi:hypothetical protein
MPIVPSTHGPNANGGRDPKTGKFLPGNRHGRGNPLAGRAAAIRAELLQVLTPAKARKIALQLIAKAEQGELPYVRELLDRTIGKPAQSEMIERIERIESLLEDRA